MASSLISVLLSNSVTNFFNLTFFTPFLAALGGTTGLENESASFYNNIYAFASNFSYTNPTNAGALPLIETNFSYGSALIINGVLRNCSFFSLFLSMIFYWIQTAFSSPPVAYYRNDVIVAPSLLHPITVSSNSNRLDAPVFLISFLEKVKQVPNFAGTALMIISNFLLMCLLIFRWKESGHFPLSNLYESLMFLSWSCTFIHLVLELKTELIRSDAILLKQCLGSITSPIALFTNAFATFNLPAEMQKAAPLVPALQSNWLMMHVTVMIISYSALILGSLLSIAFLILISSFSFSFFDFSFLKQKGAKNGNQTSTKTPFNTPSSSFQATDVLLLFSKSDKKKSALVPSKAKMTLAWNFDNLSYRVLGIGFPFLTIGILSGAVWANEAWGSYWSWDPKETWALLTWLIFAIYLHARITKGWQGKKPAIIASFGFLAIWICFLGVNLIGEGLHSYGWFSNS
uniref:Cytochrome c biogenesis protein CcsA n=1 Tax=Chlamydomonas nivalis TaxID=47906 RepID=A0A0S2IAV5_9CHLO|nr:heme attachment to plastid cytochrome c [Chlamydomonas nivalis]